ncbi:MAG: hypothetical protein D6798_07305, partial [Deltaproteobacteria bacterium]
MALAALSMVACDRSGADLLPQPNENFPSVIEIGELAVMDIDDVPSVSPQNCADPSTDGCYFGQLSSTDNVTVGGATFTFRGTGGKVCVIVDQETVSWNHYIGPANSNSAWVFPDYSSDDGDIDLYGGLSSYYTGSPGIEIGDFSGYYTDSLGRQIAIDYVACRNSSPYTGQEAHAGRGAPEYCTIDTTGHAGAEYTVVLETFSVPNDDGLLSFATAVADGACGNIPAVSLPAAHDITVGDVNECTILGESIAEDGTVNACTTALEQAYCANTTSDGEGVLVGFCCNNPGMCGDPPEGACDEYTTGLFCDQWPALC